MALNKEGGASERSGASPALFRATQIGVSMPEQPEFEIDVRTIGAVEMEQENSAVPNWCEIKLEITALGHTKSAFLTRRAGEVMIDALHEVLHPWAGLSIYESTWEELDKMVDHLEEHPDDQETKWKAQGLSLALAHYLNPYHPDLDMVRTEAMRRKGEREPQGGQGRKRPVHEGTGDRDPDSSADMAGDLVDGQ